ncbi:uncharacterized protein LOC135494099 [Lineus longissimus]|uniref:uncharacterized protein LOC135494099 n=1 Tax=Lineus longissimus TaxID=88925 RepID=UPI00315CC336
MEVVLPRSDFLPILNISVCVPSVAAPPPADNFHVAVTPPGLLLSRPIGSHMMLLCHLKTKEHLPGLRLYFQTFDGAKVLPGSNSIITSKDEWPHVKVYLKFDKKIEGPVSCHAEDPLTGRHALDSKQIKTYNPLTVTAFPDQTLKLGRGSLLECLVGGGSGNDTVVAWLRGGQLVNINDSSKYKVRDTGLLIKNVETSDAGTYICRAEDAAKGLMLQKKITATIK